MFYKRNGNKKRLLEMYLPFTGQNGRYIYDESDADYTYDEIGQAIVQLCAKSEYRYSIKPDEDKEHVYHCSDEYVNFTVALYRTWNKEYEPYIEDLNVHFYVPDTEHDILQTVVNFNKALSDMKFKK